MLKKVLYTFSIILWFFLSSCSKDEDETPSPDSPSPSKSNKSKDADSGDPQPAKPKTEDEMKRAAAIKDYKDYMVSTQSTVTSWAGANEADCIPGDISPAARNAVLKRINYFRKQVGYTTDLSLGSAASHAKAQASALIMRANNSLSHVPPRSWLCYTTGGAEASVGNLRRNSADGNRVAVSSIVSFMEDSGDHNTAVTHRAWFLYPGIDKIAVGATANTATIWWERRDAPVSAPEFVAWPPEGYVVDDLVFARWSIHINNPRTTALNGRTDASGASVRMLELHTGRPLSPRIVHRYNDQGVIPYSTLVWEPEGIEKPDNASTDIVYRVTVSNLVVNGETKEYIYEVKLIDAATALN